ncbi:serine/threonine-protein kinase [Rubellimicrobium roseum]|uniref:Serine/threonine protein kinase n=1 Tax=Rubellimicrobium roseum TaxID=687525 RepID=A0A5C4ND06_9RHOB|nr:serine/threonine-protein kinase [Rubellimicrobium roseum]TNC72573.1 serine/threonine protein kinase [Rubellimicrobium roseum]
MLALAPVNLQAGQAIPNKYEVVRPLGRGAFGEVYHVRNLHLGRDSALKLIRVEDPSSYREIVEAQAQYLCTHDHVVKVLTADVLNGAVLIEMELLEGGSLGDALMRGFVPAIDSMVYMKHVLFALEHAHAKGIVHRDVKPGNIMLSGSVAKLSDFGTVIHPESGIMASACFYHPHASPEAANGYEFSAASDVYAAGVTLLRAVNNQPSLGAVLADPEWPRLVSEGRLAARIGFADHVPPALKRLINKATHADIEQRFRSAKEFRQALERLRPARPWIRMSDDRWTCSYGGKEEIAQVQPGPCPTVIYTVDGRRRREHCGSYRTEHEARHQLARIIAQTTLH